MDGILRFLHDGDDDHDHDDANSTVILLLKIGSLILILGVTLLFGYFPLIW
jgi:hypothetical protein